MGDHPGRCPVHGEPCCGQAGCCHPSWMDPRPPIVQLREAVRALDADPTSKACAEAVVATGRLVAYQPTLIIPTGMPVLVV